MTCAKWFIIWAYFGHDRWVKGFTQNNRTSKQPGFHHQTLGFFTWFKPGQNACWNMKNTGHLTVTDGGFNMIWAKTMVCMARNVYSNIEQGNMVMQPSKTQANTVSKRPFLAPWCIIGIFWGPRGPRGTSQRLLSGGQLQLESWKPQQQSQGCSASLEVTGTKVGYPADWENLAYIVLISWTLVDYFQIQVDYGNISWMI